MVLGSCFMECKGMCAGSEVGGGVGKNWWLLRGF